MSFTIEQQRALAIADAQIRVQEQPTADAQKSPLRKINAMDWGKGYGPAMHDIGGRVTDALAPHVPAQVAGAAGAAAYTAGEAIPMLFGGNTAAASKAPAIAQDAGRWLMKTAIKPAAGDAIRGKVAPAIETMLQQGYSPTNAGVAAMRTKAGAATDKAGEIIEQSNKLVDVAPAEQNLAALAERLKAGTRGAEKVEETQTVAKLLREHPSNTGGMMSVQDAQAMKKANYRDIGDNAYGLGLKEAAGRDSLKAATAALRKGIERAEPGVAPLNAQAAELINASKVSQRRALMEGNKDPLSLGVSLATALHNPVAALGLFANSSAATKAMLARMLYSGAKPASFAAGAGAGYAATNSENK